MNRGDRRRMVIEIGGLAIALDCAEAGFVRLIEENYAGFLAPSDAPAACEFTIELAPPRQVNPDDDVQVSFADGRWCVRRGDFEAQYEPCSGRGWVRHTANPYSVDTLLRIVHTLLLAPEGGFLIHAAGAIRNGRALIFAGVSGAGKTTICRLAPPDVILLSDEICYVRRQNGGYVVHGTPFAGELGIPGVKVSAPAGAVYLPARGETHALKPLKPAEAARELLRCILFFADDRELAANVFASACDFVSRTPAYRLEFRPEPSVWEFLR